MRISLLAGAACALLVTACGDDKPANTVTPVRLQISTPRDLDSVREPRVIVRGTVRPADAVVTVRGARAKVRGGAWSADVSLEPGVNVVDILASAGHARPALTAVRVRRIIDVTVPDLVGLSQEDAQRALDDANLEASFEADDRDGGLLDEILGRKPKVCATDPEAGTHVDPGSTVTVQLARGC
jgi:hypothetical protein